jgi:hypothetical protein
VYESGTTHQPCVVLIFVDISEELKLIVLENVLKFGFAQCFLVIGCKRCTFGKTVRKAVLDFPISSGQETLGFHGLMAGTTHCDHSVKVVSARLLHCQVILCNYVKGR